jgi:ribose transport system substrate-binding protein
MHRVGSLLAAASLAITGGACSADNPGKPDDNSSASAPASDVAAQALEAAFAGSVGEPPTTPTKPKAGVNLWVVSCGEQIPSCATPTAATVEAAKLVGWQTNVCDGQLNPNGWGTCVRQAISAKAEVIIPIGIDCISIQQPFAEAKDAGVVVVGGGGADCDKAGGEALWATERLQLEGVGIIDYWRKAGATIADYLIGATDGAAKVVELKFTDPIWGGWLSEGFNTQIDSCGGCEVVDVVEFSNNDVISGVAIEKFGTALQRAATANAVFVPVGGLMPAGFAQAVVSSGRQADLTVASSFGNAANMELVRNNAGQNAVLGYATEWGGWGSVDTAIRVVNGEDPVVEGDGFQMIDAEHNLPPAGEDYQGSGDFKAAYRAVWGIS